MRKIGAGNWNRFGCLCLLIALPWAAIGAPEAKKPTPDSAPKPDELSVSNDLTRAYLQLQGKIRDAELEIDRARQESQVAAAKSAEDIANRLQNIEQSVATQRLSEVEAMQSTTRFMLVALSAFAGIGFLAVTFTAYFQWRAITRLAQMTSMPAPGRTLERLPALPAFSLHEERAAAPGPADPPNPRLLGAVERLEKRISELEHATTPPIADHSEKNGVTIPAAVSTAAATTEIVAEPPAELVRGDHSQATLLLDKGQLFLDQNEPQEALSCFDQALALDPSNTEALVRKGAALEKLQKLNEAIDCYNRAIAADNSMTIAYLHKGGLFNRMERFSEAVECYEQALRTQEKQHA